MCQSKFPECHRAPPEPVKRPEPDDPCKPKPIWNLPDPYGEPLCWLKVLVRVEAEHQIEVWDVLHLDDPDPEDWEMRRAGVESHLWTWLTSGWARVTDDRDAVLFWNPETLAFEPWTAELYLTYDRIERDLRALRNAEHGLYTGPVKDSEKLPEMQEESYVGGVSVLAPAGGAYTGKA